MQREMLGHRIEITVSLLKKNHGLTFVELLIAMLMGLLVLGAVLNIFVSQNRTNAVQQEVAYAQQNVRAAMDLMAREIRSAGYDPTLSALTPIPTATATSIQVRADFVNGGDGTTGQAGEDVTYSEVTDASGTYLVRNDTFTSDNIVYDVIPGSLQFTYYQSGSSTSFSPATQSDRDDIRVVGVQFQVHTQNEEPGYTGGYDLIAGNSGTCRTRSMATRVRVRNMGFKDIE
jgi:type IV pilus assembly protein PilW